MKPVKILVFVLAVIVGLGILMLVFPNNGIKITKNLSLQFITIDELLKTEEPLLNIDSIVGNQVDIDSLSDLTETDSTAQLDVEELKKLITPIQYPDGDSTILWKFFAKLDSIEELGKLRIIHYGDSQIEGDRITSFVRYKLQNKFGGLGYGLNTVGKLYAQFSMVQEDSDNWLRYSSFQNVDERIKHEKYGAMLALSRFTPIRDSLEPISETKTNAWIDFSVSNLSYSNTRTFKRINLFYGNSISPTSVVVSVNDSIVLESELEIDTSINVLTYTAPEYIDNIRLEFEAFESPDFYGISFEDDKGLIMDNIGLRGSSGLLFQNVNYEHVAEMYRILGVDLFILQFGGNFLPNLKTEEQAQKFVDYYQAHIELLRNLVPNAHIIVIGPSDMATKEKAEFVTYPLLETVIEKIEQVTYDEGGAFWNMYEAMGGNNSMKSWVATDPPLASTDYTHFTPHGAQVIANMFYNALILEYSQYQNSIPDTSNTE